MPPIVLIPDSFAAVEPRRCAFMASSLLPCTPMATEPHVQWSDRVGFWGAEGMQPTSRRPHPVGKTP